MAGNPMHTQEEFLPHHQPQPYHSHQHLFPKYLTYLQPINPPQTPLPICLNLPPTHLLSQVPPQVPYQLLETPSPLMRLQWLTLSIWTSQATSSSRKALEFNLIGFHREAPTIVFQLYCYTCNDYNGFWDLTWLLSGGGSKDSQLFRQQCCKVIYTSK